VSNGVSLERWEAWYVFGRSKFALPFSGTQWRLNEGILKGEETDPIFT
jgi:hypothetical protein